MKLLLYGIIPVHSTLSLTTGIGGLPLSAHDGEGFRVISSQHASDGPLNSPDHLREFYRVISAVISETDIVPFRFATLISDETLTSVLAKRASIFRAALADTAGCVQMDVRQPIQSEGARPSTGRMYLEQKSQAAGRLSEVSTEAVDYFGPVSKDIKVASRRGATVLSALVPRERQTEFMALARKKYPEARITGPWAPAAFVAAELT